MSLRPFALFSWHEPFLPALLNYVSENTNNTLRNSVIILPHNRPKQYLSDIIKKNTNIPKPLLLPSMFTMHEIIDLFCAQGKNSLQNASLLDRVHLLYVAVKQVSKENDLVGKHFASMDLANFLPWGTRLADLFEEYMLNMQDIENIQHTEGEVSSQAAALLSSLNKIHQNYLALLEKKSWTTQGLNALLAATHFEIPHTLNIKTTENKQIFIAGFLAPHKAEQKILHSLWQNGAHICLHSDPRLGDAALNQKAHWSCFDHKQWIKDWNAKYYSYTSSDEPSSTNYAKNHFLSGHDIHSQLLAVKNLLNNQSNTIKKPSTAIILTSPSLLMPMLHHLPDEEFNISMGYPLNKSPLFALLDAIMNLHTSSFERNTTLQYYWKNVLHCLRHPYIQMLKTLPLQAALGQDQHEQAMDEQSIFEQVKPIRNILHQMEHALRQGSRYVELHGLANEHTAICSKDERNLINDIITALVDNFSSLKTPADLAQALMNLCQLLLNYGNDIWINSPLDAEALYRLMQRVIPTLKSSAIADEHLPILTLFNLVQHLMQAERVPFEADPITGLQILGLLDTRLLHFERLIVIDATDDVLPGFAAQDPLLPDALRHVLGLADANKRERIISFTLHRLMASAKDVHFFWQEGIARSNLFDGKKSRSRFIDSAIWQEEQEVGHIIESGNAPLSVAPCVINPIKREPQHIVVTDEIRQKLLNMLANGISPTRIDNYIQCPQSFAWKNIYKFTPLEEVNENYNPLIVGDLLHKILHNLYKNFEGKRVYKEDISSENIQSCLKTHFKNEKLEEILPPDSLIMLELAAPLRLKNFLKNQPDSTHIMALEKTLLAPIKTKQAFNFQLKGILDRLDRRTMHGTQQLIVLDYKTGKLPKLKVDVWDDGEFWDELEAWTPEVNDGLELLKQVSNAFESVQLPCYIHLCHENYMENVFDAAFVNLGEDGEERYLLGEEPNEIWREYVVRKQIPILLSFVLRHMATASTLPPTQGNHCKYCHYNILCMR